MCDAPPLGGGGGGVADGADCVAYAGRDPPAIGIWLPFAYMHCMYVMSKRRCTVVPALLALPAPIAVPPSNPPPAPTIAPVAGFPAAAPIAAPAAAPTAVPTAAPRTVLCVVACFVVVPVCCIAQCRQTASSDWNCSKFFPLPGRTITLGPVGIVAHAVMPSAATIASAAPVTFIDSPDLPIDAAAY